MVVDNVSKWMELLTLPTNNARVLVNFFKKNIFSRFNTQRAIISGGGKQFYNSQFKSLLTKYGVHHYVETSYHPQINGQVNVSIRQLK